MTRDEFMEEEKKKINDILINERNEFLSLIDKAWEEGKKSAETEAIESKANDILEALRKQISDAAGASKIYINPPEIDKWHYPINPCTPLTDPSVTNIPEGCRHCPNHPSNGGSGICHCIIGTQPIMCNSTVNDICDAIEKDKINVSDEICSTIGNLRDKEVYNACCDNHIKIIHDMMTGTKTEETE